MGSLVSVRTENPENSGLNAFYTPSRSAKGTTHALQVFFCMNLAALNVLVHVPPCTCTGVFKGIYLEVEVSWEKIWLNSTLNCFPVCYTNLHSTSSAWNFLTKSFASLVGVASHYGFNLQFPALMRVSVFPQMYWPSLFSLQCNTYLLLVLIGLLGFWVCFFFLLPIIRMLSGTFIG